MAESVNTRKLKVYSLLEARPCAGGNQNRVTGNLWPDEREAAADDESLDCLTLFYANKSILLTKVFYDDALTV